MPSVKLSHKPILDMPSKKQLEKVIRPYSDEGLQISPEQQEKLKRLMEFFDLHGIDYSKFKPEHMSFISNKRSYPNYDQYQYMPGRHDMQKWMYAVKDVHYKQKAGLPFKEAIKGATGGWAKMEIYDFLNWLRFHEEGAHMKYKFAQTWYENDQPGYFLHIKPDAPTPAEPHTDHQAVQDAKDQAEAQAVRDEEKRTTIERQRAKIIGRLDSAEKLLRSPEGQQFAGDELEQLMEAIYTLKKKVQLVNKLSVSTRLYEDMIVREGNVLKRGGFNKAAAMLYSLAQSPGQSGEAVPEKGKEKGGNLPVASSPPDPSGAGQSGTMSGLPATAPGVPNVQSPDDAAGAGDQNKQPPAGALMGGGNAPTGTAQSTPPMPMDKPNPPGINKFIDNMNEGNKTDNTKSEDDELEVSDKEEELMVTEAQLAPPAPPGVPPAALEDVPIIDDPKPERNPPDFIPNAAPKPPKEEEPLEVTENDIPPAGGDTPSGGDTSALDAKLDATFETVTMAEIVAELEDISTYYKIREMPRRLARLDMMFDGKGISAYFPSLAEAQNRALDANNYISTRIDDILSKVRGAMVNQDMGAKLKGDQEKEKQRKQMRKEQENAELEGGGGGPGGPAKETPEVEMGELSAPPATPQAAPAARGPAPRPLG